MQTIFGMGFLLLWILTLVFAASIDEDGTIRDRATRILIRCEMRLDQRKEQLVLATLHAAIINGCGFTQFSRVE